MDQQDENGRRVVGRRRRRLNVTLPPGLVVRAMEQARREGRSLSRLIEALLSEYTAPPMSWTQADVDRYHLSFTTDEPAQDQGPQVT